jgi:hypothetical protein
MTLPPVLGGFYRLVAGKQLNVTQAAAGAVHILGGGGDESPAS